MVNKRHSQAPSSTEPFAPFVSLCKTAGKRVLQKFEMLLKYPWHEQMKNLRQKLLGIDYKRLIKQEWQQIRKFKLKKFHPYKLLRKSVHKLSGLSKMFLIGVPTFLVCYYTLGCLLAENIDVQTEYKARLNHIPMFETTETMSFLLKREVDDKMWTPNLPPIFPAYVLDNMPDFQIGIIHALRDITAVVQHFSQNTDAQKKDIKKAVELLAYPPTIWLMNKKDGLSLAPSTNAQYRKAAVELYKFSKDGIFYPRAADLRELLQKVCHSLQKLAQKNETHQNEHASDWIDTKADDLFYLAKGYAFAMWQITKTMGRDFRETLLEANLYTEWTYLINSLKKAAIFSPHFVRNATPDSLFAANHLIVQNYYLLRAVTAAEKINNKLSEGCHADKD